MKALELDGSLLEVHRDLILLYEAQEKWPQAEERYRRYLSEQPDDHRLRARLGEHYLRQGKTEAGIEELQRVFQAEPNRKDVARVLGEEYSKLRKLS